MKHFFLVFINLKFTLIGHCWTFCTYCENIYDSFYNKVSQLHAQFYKKEKDDVLYFLSSEIVHVASDFVSTVFVHLFYERIFLFLFQNGLF